MQNLPVLISGAGPTGLTMAVELQRYGIPFRIIDKHTKPVLTSNALGVQIRTLEVWDDMGILDAALAQGNKLRGMNVYAKKQQIAHINLGVIKNSYNFLLGLPQRQTETLLINELSKKNIAIEMEVELIDFKENEKFILATVKHKNGEIEQIKTDWLIACDGGHSFIREKANVPFNGRELPQHFVLADAEIHSELPLDEANLFISDKGIFVLLKFDDKYTRIIAEVSNVSELSKAKSLTYDQVKKLAEERCPFKLDIREPIWSSGFWIHEKIVPNYRDNRIFFAGDAAHIHSPVGGQGMNTGIQDAYNLAWKLALVIQGKAKPIILGTYNSERHPVGEAVLRATTLMTHIVALHNRLLIAIRNWFISHAMKIKRLQEKFIDNVSQLKIHYQANILVDDCLGNQPGPRAGTSMLDVKFYDQDKSERLFDLVRGIQFVLLMFASGNNNSVGDNFLLLKKTLAEKYPDQIKFIFISDKNDFYNWHDEKIWDADLRIHKCYGVTKPCFYLIRPDKYIGFRGDLENQERLIHYFEQAF